MPRCRMRRVPGGAQYRCEQQIDLANAAAIGVHVVFETLVQRVADTVPDVVGIARLKQQIVGCLICLEIVFCRIIELCPDKYYKWYNCW